MNKKIIICLVVLATIVIIGGVYFLSRSANSGGGISLSDFLPSQKQQQPTASVGWSVVESETEAAQEAVSVMRSGLTADPTFAFLYCASGYNEEAIVAEVRRLLPNTKIIGGNSGYGVMTPGGYFWYPVSEQSIAILGIANEKITWGVSGVLAEGISSREAAKQALNNAMASIGKTDEPDLVINIPSFDMEHDEVLKGIADVLGEEVPVFGAYSVDRGIGGDWRVFANDQVFHSGVAVAVVYTDLKIGFAREHGFEITEGGGIITKANGKELIEIDGRPAGEVYNELIGGTISSAVNDPANADISKTRLASTISPLAKVFKMPSGGLFYIPMLLVKVLPGKSLLFDSNLKEGDELKVLRGDWEILLNRLRTVPAKVMANFDIDKEKVVFALDSFCCATHYVIPATERQKSPQILTEALGATTPFIVICACGIQIPEPSVGNLYTSLGNGMLMFSEK